MKKAFLSLLLSFAFFSGVVSAQTEDPFRGMSGYVLSTNVDWGVVRFGLNKFDRVFTNTTWLSNADGFYGGAAVANGVMYGTTVYQELYKFNLEDGTWTKSSTNKYWEDMAYDYTTNTMYCIIENGFGKLDLETGMSTLIKFYPNTYFWGIGCTHDGRLYAIGQDGYLYSIDKETGNEEIIGDTGLVSQYICCAAIDPNTDVMYFEHCTNDFDKLYRIDLETAQATFVCNYDDISGLSFDYTPIGISETDANTNSIESTVYPNPTRGDILIKTDDMKRVTITNSLGQTVMDAEATSNSMIIDMREYGVGMYIVRIETENGMGTHKVIVTE
ncbi:MAG: T9SS type A sorting domain-containing protein [Bacteroidales bacterium]|nr:T9SS type A sorting domain-containing protein [Bacteroidales bacterium]